MKFIFYASDKPREQDLAKAFQTGAILHGHECHIRRLTDGLEPCDWAMMVGVKSARLWQECLKAGIKPAMADKGYSRHKRGGWCEYWRISFGAHNPTLTTLTKCGYPSDRFDSLGFDVKPWRESGNHILICGSSEKYHSFYGLDHPNRWAKRVVARIREHSGRPIIYRPKPSWKGAEPIEGTIFSDSKQALSEVLTDCHCVVTHGSNASFEAALFGIPSVVLGEAVMRPESSISLKDIEHPYMGNRQRIFNAVAYHQWTNAELANGEAFKTIEEWM